MPDKIDKEAVSPKAIFGENVFSVKTMRRYLPPAAYRSLLSTIYRGKSLDRQVADQVAAAMKDWALSKGATHFTHWFQPLTGSTAEKHEAFILPDHAGGAITSFRGADLIRGEPDASNFPSGGLRATFEARGYTAWDPTSPAFIKAGRNGATLCIPSVFCGYHGEALDKKTPLLRSMEALDRQMRRLGKLFGIASARQRVYASLGAEQEYFLIDKKFYEKRLDLLQTGRTLFGRKPAKHQQMEDHYFGAIKPRIMRFMGDLDRALWRLGIPAKTRHNEVCPGQFEIVPVHEELNLAVDHNMVLMEVLRELADDHGLACLLHEKPFAGVNGSGKHNNWSIVGPDGRNWLTPGDNPHENAKFLTIICAFIKAVDTRANVLRATVATAGNDLRLGTHEAPPAIISVFLGEELTNILAQLERGLPGSSPKNGALAIGVSTLPDLPRDTTDRNRTSPLAFTGNKFELRALGSSQSCAGANVALNTIMAEALDEICDSLEKELAAGQDFNLALQAILRELLRKHKRVIFNGDNYSAAWHKEAARRGLSAARTTPQALRAYRASAVIAMFAKYGVLSARELASRYEVYLDIYNKTLAVEAECSLTIAKTMIVPAALRYQTELAQALLSLGALGGPAVPAQRAWLKKVAAELEGLLGNIAKLEAVWPGSSAPQIIKAMLALRRSVDNLEALVPKQLWPLPTYAEMMFML